MGTKAIVAIADLGTPIGLTGLGDGGCGDGVCVSVTPRPRVFLL
jgi:hypothetical protein